MNKFNWKAAINGVSFLIFGGALLIGSFNFCFYISNGSFWGLALMLSPVLITAFIVLGGIPHDNN